jgi:hypothetical protein
MSFIWPSSLLQEDSKIGANYTTTRLKPPKRRCEDGDQEGIKGHNFRRVIKHIHHICAACIRVVKPKPYAPKIQPY